MNRRDLLKKMKVAGSGLSLSSAMAEPTARTGHEQKIGLAILGLGFFASYVIPRIQFSAHTTITALISSDPNKASQWVESFGLSGVKIYAYETMDRIKEDPAIDAVYIATPVGTHAQFAIQALQAGKHVMVEKTMAATFAEGQRMIQMAREMGRKLMVAYRARNEPFNQQAIDWAKEQTYGAVRAITAHKGFLIGDRLGKDQWRLNKKLAGGGALLDIGIYSIQASRYLAGSEPIAALAMTQDIDPRMDEVESHLTFMLKFPNGVLATGSASWGYDLQNHYTVGTEHASYSLHPATSNGNLRLHVTQHQPKQITEHFLRDVDQIEAEFAHFADCIHNDLTPLTDGEEGLNDLRVIEALYLSVAENRVVKL